MIIENDKNFPMVVLIIDNYLSYDAKLLKNILNHYNNKSIKEDIFFNLHIDLYDLDDYETSALNYTFDFLKEIHFPKLVNVTIYLNKSKFNYLIKAAAYLSSYSYNEINIKIEEIEDKKIW